MPPVVAMMIFAGLALHGCKLMPTPNSFTGWQDRWYYNDNRGVDQKTDKPRIDGKNNTR